MLDKVRRAEALTFAPMPAVVRNGQQAKGAHSGRILKQACCILTIDTRYRSHFNMSRSVLLGNAGAGCSAPSLQPGSRLPVIMRIPPGQRIGQFEFAMLKSAIRIRSPPQNGIVRTGPVAQ